MNLFLIYRFTGEDPAELRTTLGTLCEALESGGHKVFCSIREEERFRREGMTTNQIYEYCDAQVANNDFLVAFIRREEDSKGMRGEVELARCIGKPIILAIKRGLDHGYYRDAARHTIEWETLDELANRFRTFDASSMALGFGEL